jgi:hypothetical protein
MDADTEAEGASAPDASGVPAEQATEVAATQRPQGEDPALVAAQREERARRRLRQTARDMILSMLVVAAGVLALWLPFHRSTPDPVKTVDPTSVMVGARASETWPVLAPAGLASTWRCTSARVDTALDGQDIVHLGYLTPDNLYVGLEQSATKALTFVTDATVGGRQTGSREVGGTTWTTYQSDDGTHRSLVRTGGGATYVVVGTAPWGVIDTFTSSLRPG